MKKILLAIATIAFAITAQITSAHEFKAGDLEILHPNARAMLNGQKVGGGFITITNHGKSDDRLISVTSPATPNVQLHDMAVVDGVMTMRQFKDGIAVPAGMTVKLEHGGPHIMFMDVKKPFTEGDVIDATLHFEKAGDVDVKFMVGPANGGDMKAIHHDHAAMSDMSQPEDPALAIPMVMKVMFEKPDHPLMVEPVNIDGDWAVAGWAQDRNGGRALLKKGEKGWAIHLCSGAGIKNAAGLKATGMPDDVAEKLAASIARSEAKLGPEKIALFDSFEGTVMMSAKDAH